MTHPPLPPELREILDDADIAPYRDALVATARPCWRLDRERITRLRLGLLSRALGRTAGPPRLPPEASKLGGLPYLEDASHWPRSPRGEPLSFVAQINFAELPPLPAPSPRSGIFVLFWGPEEPYYQWRWYPTPGRPIACAGPCTSHWEWRLTATPATSVSFASWWGQEETVEGAFDRLCAWHETRGGDVGAWTPATLSSDAPTTWLGHPPAVDEPWLQVWTQRLEERFGSLETSIVVRQDDFEAARLDRCAVIEWQ